jgi:AraC family transcriptional regulator
MAEHAREVIIAIEPRFFKEFDLAESEMAAALYNNPGASFVMLDIYREIVDADEFSTPSIRLLLLSLIQPANQLKLIGKAPPWVEKVREQLHDNWDGQISLQELAACANVHPVTISKYFQRYFSCNLGAYQRKLKIERALSLIKSSKKSLTEIAYECGFSDQSHFIRTFKQLTAYLPSTYQRL